MKPIHFLAFPVLALIATVKAHAVDGAPGNPVTQAPGETKAQAKTRQQLARATGRASARIVAAVSAGYERGKLHFRSDRRVQRLETRNGTRIFALE